MTITKKEIMVKISIFAVVIVFIGILSTFPEITETLFIFFNK